MAMAVRRGYESLPGELMPISRSARYAHNAATAANAATRRIPLISPGISGSLGKTGTLVPLPRRLRQPVRIFCRAGVPARCHAA